MSTQHAFLGSPGFGIEKDRELLLSSFDVITPDIGRALAITALASRAPAPTSAPDVTRILNNSQGSSPGRVALLTGDKAIKSRFDFPLTTGGLVRVAKYPGGKGGSTDLYSLTEVANDHALALAGEIMRIQLKYPNIPTSLSLAPEGGRNGLLHTHDRLVILARLLDRPGEFKSLSSITAGSPIHSVAESLYISGFVQRKVYADADATEFEIRKPKTYAPSKSSDINIMFHEAAMELLDEGQAIITAGDLLARILLLHPDVDIDTVRTRFSQSRPNYITPISRPGSTRSTDKVAIRIAPAYIALVTEILESINKLAASRDARQEARHFGQQVLSCNPQAMTELMRLAFVAEPEPAIGIPAPDYEGWHAGKHEVRPWRPTFSSTTN